MVKTRSFFGGRGDLINPLEHGDTMYTTYVPFHHTSYLWYSYVYLFKDTVRRSGYSAQEDMTISEWRTEK